MKEIFYLSIIASFLLLNGCAVVASVTGASTSTATAIRIADGAGTAVDLVRLAENENTMIDNLISYSTNKNCHLTNIFNQVSICEINNDTN